MADCSQKVGALNIERGAALHRWPSAWGTRHTDVLRVCQYFHKQSSGHHFTKSHIIIGPEIGVASASREKRVNCVIEAARLSITQLPNSPLANSALAVKYRNIFCTESAETLKHTSIRSASADSGRRKLRPPMLINQSVTSWLGRARYGECRFVVGGKAMYYSGSEPPTIMPGHGFRLAKVLSWKQNRVVGATDRLDT